NKPVLDHIGIAVKSLDSAKIYEALGLTIDHVEVVETQGVKTAFLSIGDSNLELLEPTGPDSPVAKFIEKRGEGIHHICFRVDGIFLDEPAGAIKSYAQRFEEVVGMTVHAYLGDAGAAPSV